MPGCVGGDAWVRELRLGGPQLAVHSCIDGGKPGRYLISKTLTVALLLAAALSQAAIDIPGADGSDGSLHVGANTIIDLSKAPSATWDTASSPSGNNGSNAGNGVYDPTQWAVVFKYASVTVEAGATLTFVNHPTRAPVVWLVVTV